MILRKTARIVMGISAWALLVALPALAQRPGRRGWARHYNPATEVRVKGTVQKARQVGRYGAGPADGLLAREVQKDGKTLVLRDANGIPEWSRARRGI